MKDYIIELNNLTFSYSDGTKALNNLNLKIERGKKISFLGINGAGKSTLFLHLNGILKPTKGEIVFNNMPLKYSQKELKKIRQKIGIVFQDPDIQLFSANVYQEVSFGAMNLNLEKAEVIRRVDKALQDTNVFEYKHKPTHFLSYGQKKRVSIADILVMEPEVIILDEPTSSLDPKHSAMIEELLNDINKTGTTLLLSTHDIDFAYSWSDYIFILKDGELVGEGTPEEVFQNDHWIEAGSIEKPMVFQVYEAMKHKGLLNSEFAPRNKKQLLDLINF
ncbi:energy-coupling factor ABC transporter ATP-binding protein [Clostridium sp. UBA4548]|uniref:energy-coupling factor ABC transporter ATP-binding protein n=1 Tax=Clostridium sp. UBA4548 TaxID=1946361 RepID=UPI0025C54A39|nr:ATP-binding cassette domain-containing protein [Clostridium sp. UBA4548]